MARELDTGPQEFVFLSAESREGQVFGWVLITVGAMMLAIALYSISRGVAFLYVSGFGIAAAALALGALSIIAPRPLRLHRWAFMLPAMGCLERLTSRRWIRYNEIIEITITTTSGGASYFKVRIGSGESEVPQFMIGEEGLRRLRGKIAPGLITFEGPSDSPALSARG